MVRIESNCSGCYDSDSYCIGYCPHKSFPVLYCDKCNTATDELFELGKEQLCLDCLKDETRLSDSDLGLE